MQGSGPQPDRAAAVARRLLALADAEPESELITQMRLHKLLYYVQAWSLAYRGRPMFRGRIEAWAHGPVVRGLYPRFADYDRGPIPADAAADAGELPDDDRAFVESVWASYKRYSASELRRMTHREAPWLEARGDLADDAPSRSEVTQESMLRCFTAKLREHEKEIPGLDTATVRESEEQLRRGESVSLDDIAARIGYSVSD